MATGHLTKSKIDSFTYAGGTDVRWDEKLTGFGVRIFASGKKSFVYAYRTAGRKRQLTLGRFGHITLEKGRELARAAAAQIAEGRDPLQERQDARRGDTFADLQKAYIAHLQAHQRKTWQATQRRLERHIPRAWLARRLDTISRAEVAQLHKDIGAKTPTNANRTLESLRSIFNYAKTVELLDESAPNPGERITRFKELKRERFVLPHELPRLFEAIDADPSVHRRAYFWLLLLTGARRSELQWAEWQHVEWEAKRLRLPETKAGKAQFIPLSSSAVAIFEAIPRSEGSPFVFPGLRKRAREPRPIANLSEPWRLILKRAELTDLRIHDLRRTVGSYMSQSGVDLNTIKEGLRHASISTTLTYARLGADPARAALEEHGRHISSYSEPRSKI